ncbi:MAG TPA: BofC C-terminal domain-containing protein [Bacilli bacterium]
MNYANMLKQLKKRLRKKRNRLSLAFWCIACLLALLSLLFPGFAASSLALVSGAPANPAAASAVNLPASPDKDGKKEVILHRQYACGEETTHLGSKTLREVQSLLTQHPGLRLEKTTFDRIELTEKINDLSAKCKENAYFGLDENGNLTLFDGLPSEKRAVRTFFQLDIAQLKSSLPVETVKQLYDGIRIRDYAEYTSVLSTFSDFAVKATTLTQ